MFVDITGNITDKQFASIIMHVTNYKANDDDDDDLYFLLLGVVFVHKGANLLRVRTAILLQTISGIEVNIPRSVN